MVLFYFIFMLLMVTYAVLIAFYHRHWNRIPDTFPVNSNGTGGAEIAEIGRHTGKAEIAAAGPQTSLPRISIIIPMRNEAGNIPMLIQSLKNQDYPKSLTEIILVDDYSTDDTWTLISAIGSGTSAAAFSAVASGLDLYAGGQLLIKAIRMEDLPATGGHSFKKQAIATGISVAAGSLIVTSDADCSAGPGWLSALARSHIITGSVFIAAPVRFRSHHTFLSVFESLDFITLQGITGASVYARFHTMCNGANLAYTKEAFNAVDGFNGIDHIPSGDDMLLMYKIYRKYPDKVSYLKHRSAIVDTPGSASVRGFFNQRIRWASKAVHYDDKRIFAVLLVVYLLNIFFLVAGIASFWKLNYFLFFFLMLVAKVLIEFPFVNSVAMFFGQQRLMRYFPLMQPFHIIYTIIAGWLGKFGSYEWKGRKIINHGSAIKGT